MWSACSARTSMTCSLVAMVQSFSPVLSVWLRQLICLFSMILSGMRLGHSSRQIHIHNHDFQKSTAELENVLLDAGRRHKPNALLKPKEVTEPRSHFGSSWRHLVQVVSVTVAVHVVQSKFVWFPCSLALLFPMSYRVLRNRPLNSLHFTQARHGATQLMSQSMRSMLLMSQLKRSIRPSRKQAPAVQTVVTFLCALLLVVSSAMASLAPACQLVPRIHSNASCASCLLRSSVSMSNLPHLPTSWQTCGDSFAISPTPSPARWRGCAHMRLAQSKLTSLWIHCAGAWTPCSQLRSLQWKRRALCQTGSCQRLQDQRAQAPTGVLRKAPRLARVWVVPLLPGKRQKPTFLPAQPAPEAWYQQGEYQRSAVLAKFFCGQNTTTIVKFCANAFLDTGPASYEVK